MSQARFGNCRNASACVGFGIIQDSHISVRAFPARRFVSIDVYSCRNFNTRLAVAYFRRTFGIRKVETNLVVRGREYPERDFR